MKLFYFLLTALLLVSCQSSKDVKSMSDEDLRAYADELAHRFIITDGHIDFPSTLAEKKGDLGLAFNNPGADFDYDRARRGGLDAPFMSIYVPASTQQKNDKGEHQGGGRERADSLINLVTNLVAAYPDKFALANTPTEVEANFKQGKISLPMGMENGAPIETNVANLKYFFDRGIRYITLTHGKDNQICDSSYDTARATWNGLSPFGEKVVGEMNRLGIMVDISHVDDSTFYDVMKIAKAPAIASHSSCRYYTPGFERNMSDDMIKTLAKNGGVIQINFGASFLDSAVRANKKAVDSLSKVLKANKLMSRDAEANAVIATFGKHKDFYSNVERVADHIDHVKAIAGIDYVGIGSDYDGVGDSLPEGLKDVSTYPNLIYVLLKRGYTEEEIQKICSGNVFRVWNKVIEIANNK